MTFRRAFTVVELLVVIVVIGVLAAITIVSYSNITQNANTNSIKIDLTNFSKSLELSRTSSSTDVYPDTATLAGLKPSNGATLTYNYVSGSKHYCLEETLSGLTYSITNINRTVTQSQCIYNGILGWWKFNGDATDSSGNGNNGNVVGATLTTGQNGTANGAYQLGETNMYISVGSGVGTPVTFATIGTGGFTYSIWINRTGSSSGANQWPSVMSANDSHVYYGIRTGNFSDGIYFEYGTPPYPGTSSFFQGTNASTLPLNTWHHVVVTYDGSKLAFYFDKILTTSYSNIVLNPIFGGLTFTRGSAGFVGKIDDARIYNRSLSATEISTIFDANAL